MLINFTTALGLYDVHFTTKIYHIPIVPVFTIMSYHTILIYYVYGVILNLPWICPFFGYIVYTRACRYVCNKHWHYSIHWEINEYLSHVKCYKTRFYNIDWLIQMLWTYGILLEAKNNASALKCIKNVFSVSFRLFLPEKNKNLRIARS